MGHFYLVLLAHKFEVRSKKFTLGDKWRHILTLWKAFHVSSKYFLKVLLTEHFMKMLSRNHDVIEFLDS